MNLINTRSLIRKILPLFLVVLMLGCKKESKPDKPETKEDPITTFFKGEAKPALSLPCFNGAYYRKVVSSNDRWLGIGGVVVLPHIIFDENRKNPNKPEQFLDNPSVYLGGNMNGQETDIGLTWEVIRDENGQVTPDRRSFRPFLRRTGFSETGQSATYENAPAQSQYYWYPGDTIEMLIMLIGEEKLHFEVTGEGKHFERDFNCDGYKIGSFGKFKRVNAIDQVGNEGRPVQPTQTKVLGARWEKTYYFRSYKGDVIKVPVHNGRFTDMRCPNQRFFHITSTKEDLLIGAESIDINGSGY